ncbi:ESPR-type extended signal peptide-containing protein [Neisseria leonii]|uniref:ESPR-type extended signal peptide-containing protein n=1 Tax=Neisseria leonii TaxID=2995413 RepID=UPI0030D4934D
MNHIYRTVFNRATQTWTAVAEYARAGGKGGIAPPPRLKLTALLLMLAGSGSVFADETVPPDAAVVHTVDSVQIKHTDPAKSITLSADGLDNADNRIRRLAAGEQATDAVNLAQLQAVEAKADRTGYVHVNTGDANQAEGNEQTNEGTIDAKGGARALGAVAAGSGEGLRQIRYFYRRGKRGGDRGRGSAAAAADLANTPLPSAIRPMRITYPTRRPTCPMPQRVLPSVRMRLPRKMPYISAM